MTGFSWILQVAAMRRQDYISHSFISQIRPSQRWKQREMSKKKKTLSNAKVRSICLLAMFWTAETSLLPSLQEITTGVCTLISSSLSGLQLQIQSPDFTSLKIKLNQLKTLMLTYLQRTRTCTLTPLSLSYLWLLELESADRRSRTGLSLERGVWDGDNETNPPLLCSIALTL